MWGNARLAPIPGEYRLWVVDSRGNQQHGLVSTSAIATLYRWEFPDQFNVRIENHPDGGLWLVINDPRRLKEIGAYAAKQLRATYTTWRCRGRRRDLLRELHRQVLRLQPEGDIRRDSSARDGT